MINLRSRGAKRGRAGSATELSADALVVALRTTFVPEAMEGVRGSVQDLVFAGLLRRLLTAFDDGRTG